MKRDNKKTASNKDRTQPSVSAAECAYAYLASRMRTVSETSRHLADKGYTPEEIQETVNDLIGLRYLDDYQYALRYYEYNRDKKRGTLRAARELAERGVDAETIRNAGEDFIYSSGVDEFEDALALAEREMAARAPADPESGERPGMDDRLAARIARMLENRGYGRDVIFRVLDRLR